MAKRGLFQRLLRIEPGISLVQWAYERITNNWTLVVAIVGGGGMTYLAGIDEWLSVVGPVSWGAVGIGSALIIGFGFSLIRYTSEKAGYKRIEGEAIARWSQIVDDINPLDNEFQNKIIKLDRIAHPVTNSVSNKRFVDCEIMGPGNIFFQGENTQITGVGFNDYNIVVISPRLKLLKNVTEFKSCRLFDGFIWNCSIFILPNMVKQFKDMGAEFLTLTGDPTIDGQAPQDIEAKMQP